MATDQDNLFSTIRELVRRGSNSPSDADLAAFVDLVRTDKHGGALLSSLLEAKGVSSTSEGFGDDDDSWKRKLKNQTPALAVLFATLAISLLKVTAPEIKKEAEGKVMVWPESIPLITAHGTLYYDTVEKLNDICSVTVRCSECKFTVWFYQSQSHRSKYDVDNLIAVFIGKVDTATSDVKAFGGNGEVTWKDLEKTHFPTL